jgi:hypothetical protein
MAGGFAGMLGAGGPQGFFGADQTALRRKQGEDAAVAKVMQQYAQKQQAAQAQGGQPGGQQGQGGFMGQMPPLDKMIDMLGQSGLPADQQFEALKNYGAFASPFERMMNQMEMKQLQMDNQRNMLDERMKNMTLIQQMRDDTSRSNTKDRTDTTRRGQDMNAENVDARLDTTERGQDIASEDRNRETGRKIVAQEENNKIRQQNADTATDRANTSKTSMLLKDKRAGENLDFRKMALTEKNDILKRGQDKQYQARMASIASKGTPEQKAEFEAAKSEFTQASADYRNAKMSLNSTAADIAAQADKALAAQQKMEQAAAKVQGERLPPMPSSAPSGVPDPSQLSDKEQKSFDGGKTWWHLQDGKPVKSE